MAHLLYNAVGLVQSKTPASEDFSIPYIEMNKILKSLIQNLIFSYML
jgi:hypothetical protein